MMNETEQKSDFSKETAIFFVGAGGVSMSSLTHITHCRGHKTGGSDRNQSKLTDMLANEGIDIHVGHRAENIDGYDVIVYTAAVPADNPELVAARKKGLRLMTRAEYLGMLMLGYGERIGVAGTHGKSTVTSMLAEIFMEAKLDPTVLSGAELTDMGGYYRIGNHKNFIFEACEYKDSFLSFYPTTAVITNIEYDHADYFKTFDQLFDSFLKYAEKAKSAVLNLDDRYSAELAKIYGGEKITVSINAPEAEFRAVNIEAAAEGSKFDLTRNGNTICNIRLSVPGIHNVTDALTAAATAVYYGIEPEDIVRALAKFKGAKRRFELSGTYGGAKIYNDYAHHPSEIRATLNAARQTAGSGRTVCVFQPHTYTRTKAFFDDFVKALSLADLTVLTDIYSAREDDIYGVSSKMLAEKIPGAVYAGDLTQTAEYLKTAIKDGDTVVITGAGNVIDLLKMLDIKK